MSSSVAAPREFSAVAGAPRARWSPYSCDSQAYALGLAQLVRCSNQKSAAMSWLRSQVTELQTRELFLDVGAGDGTVTAGLLGMFDRTIALEPSTALRRSLEKACPTAVAAPVSLFEYACLQKADFVLCAHVLFHLERSAWVDAVVRMTSWLAPRGKLVILLHAEQTDCRNLMKQFGILVPNLSELVEEVAGRLGDRACLQKAVIPAFIRSDELSATEEIAVFMFQEAENWLEIDRANLARVLRDRYWSTERGYLLSCDQEALLVSMN